MATEDFELDEQELITFIRNFLPQESKENFSDDDLMYILDLILEYYDSTDLEENADDDYFLVDKDDIINFILKESHKNGMGPYQPEDIAFVVEGEMEFANQFLDE